MTRILPFVFTTISRRDCKVYASLAFFFYIAYSYFSGKIQRKLIIMKIQRKLIIMADSRKGTEWFRV